MRPAADIASEMDEGLALLFQRGLELSLQVQDDAMAAATPDERAKLAVSFHRISRGVRQTAALRMKLAREAERSGHEAEARVVRLDQARLARRRSQVNAQLHRLIWSEAESDEAETALQLDLEELLDAETQDEATFLAEPLDTQVARIREALGLTPPDPPPQGEVSPQVTEGVAAPSPVRPASQLPQSLRDSSPERGATIPDHPFHSSG